MSVEEVRTGVAVVRAVGELDATTAPHVFARIGALHRRDVDVVLDLSDVYFLADAGLDGLADVLAVARARGRELRVVLCTRGVEAVVRAAGLDGVLPISRTVPEAVALAGVSSVQRIRERYARAAAEFQRVTRRSAELRRAVRDRPRRPRAAPA